MAVKKVTLKNKRTIEVNAELWDAAEEAVAGRGDGRISKGDAEKIFAIIAEDGVYDDLEKKTVKYIRREFAWTEAGDEHYRLMIRKAAGKGWTTEEVEEEIGE